MKHASVAIAPGVTYAAWTFGGTVPGPFLHVRQGDTVDFTLVNGANIPHSMDFHAAEIAPSKYYTNVMPGDSLHYRFVARVPGAFMYHCGTAPVAMHIANGMYGALVVDPATPRPKAKELVLVQSEFYLTGKADQDGNQSLDWQKLLGQAPDHIVFNGRASQYASHPLEARPNELIRIYLVNAGPNRISSFHVVGGIFERAFDSEVEKIAHEHPWYELPEPLGLVELIGIRNTLRQENLKDTSRLPAVDPVQVVFHQHRRVVVRGQDVLALPHFVDFALLQLQENRPGLVRGGQEHAVAGHDRGHRTDRRLCPRPERVCVPDIATFWAHGEQPLAGEEDGQLFAADFRDGR